MYTITNWIVFSFPVILGNVPRGGSSTVPGDLSLVLTSSNGVISGSIVEGVEGGAFTATCTAVSGIVKHAPLSMKWLPLRDQMKDHQMSQEKENNYTVKFIIAKLNRSDAGFYKCVVVMADNEVKERQLELHVKPESGSTCHLAYYNFKVLERQFFWFSMQQHIPSACLTQRALLF